MSRLYEVIDHGNGIDNQATYLVEADSQAQAIGVITAPRFSAKPASAMCVAQLMGEGYKVLSKITKTHDPLLTAPPAVTGAPVVPEVAAVGEPELPFAEPPADAQIC